MPPFGSRLTERYRAIGEFFEASDVDVVNFQEVHTYYHLRLLTTQLPSFRYALKPTAVGPAGGLVTMARRRIESNAYQRFPLPPPRFMAPLPHRSLLAAALKGCLMTRLAEPDVWFVNTHLLANFDGDWSLQNRYYELHRHQLASLTSTLDSIAPPLVVSGDFNIPRDSSLFEDFMTASGLADAFDGNCPPTFHPEYLSADATPHCIDFLLYSADTLNAEHAHLIFTDKLPMPNAPTYASDHLGLTATLTVN